MIFRFGITVLLSVMSCNQLADSTLFPHKLRGCSLAAWLLRGRQERRQSLCERARRSRQLCCVTCQILDYRGIIQNTRRCTCSYEHDGVRSLPGCQLCAYDTVPARTFDRVSNRKFDAP